MSSAVRLPPGPPGHPVLGHIRDLRRDPLTLFTRCAREYGDFVPLRFGPMRTIFLGHPDYIEYVMLTHSHNFIKSLQLRALETLLGQGLILTEGELWQRQRHLMMPAFHWQRVAGYGDTIADFTEQTVGTWKPGDVRDIHDEMMRLALRVVSKTLFDADAETIVPMARAFAEAIEGLNRRMSSLWLFVPDKVPTPNNLRLHKAVHRIDEIVLALIDERRKGGEDRGDLLSMLLQARADDASGMTDQQVRDEAVTLFAAGHETTATVLTWAFYLLWQHPAIETKLVAEVQAALGGRVPTAADLPSLKYAEMVITETMRLYPPAPGLGREAIADCEIGGYPVPKGTSLFLSMWTTHRDPRFFEEPERFWPDRWADGLATRLPRFAYFPFGGGPRRCIGASFGMMEAVLILTTVVQRFRMKPVPGQTIAPWVIPAMRPKYGIKMELQER